jgi:EAL domain-containing protein (putative c-di-GMP-specific phosphodiesterase class I)
MRGSPERLFVRSGTVLYAQGAPATAAYLVAQGRVQLFVTCKGEPRVLAERRQGDIVGEAAIVDGGPRLSSAVAVEDCELLAVTRDQISGRVEALDPLLRLCVSMLMQRHGESTDKIRQLGQPGSSGSAPWAAHFDAARELLTTEHQLRRAIERDELELKYQPIVRLSTRQLTGFEVLLRWNHPQRGLIQPNDFIPMAEASGLIHDVTAYCFRKVGQQFAGMMTEASRNPHGVEPLFVTVNVSALDLQQESFAATTAATLIDAGIDPKHVRLEITESVLIRNAERCARTLDHCREQGMMIAIDDFGTGYSSFNYLGSLPIGILKIDRSFVQPLLSDVTGRKIIGVILHLGKQLDLTVIAEGIESFEQASALADMGCDLGQGFVFGRPLGRAESLALIRTWNPAMMAGSQMALRNAG